MAETKFFREYKFKFYLNANHYIIIDGKDGQTHPHTWEFVFFIIKIENEFVLFNKFEQVIEEFFEKFQGRVLNDVEPFDKIVPTLENISDYFSREIYHLIKNQGGELVKVESSETPTRSYIIDMKDNSDFKITISKMSEDKMDMVIDKILDNIVD